MFVKNLTSTITGKISSRYNDVSPEIKSKSTDINTLLNRVKSDQKKEARRKILFTATAAGSVLLFGVLIF